MAESAFIPELAVGTRVSEQVGMYGLHQMKGKEEVIMKWSYEFDVETGCKSSMVTAVMKTKSRGCSPTAIYKLLLVCDVCF